MATPPVNNNLNTQQKTDQALVKLAVKNPTKAARTKSQIDSRADYQKKQAEKWKQNLEGNGKGFEGFITRTTKSLTNINTKIDYVYRGDPKSDRGIKIPGKEEKIKGVINFLFFLNDVDFCNLTNYILNNIVIDNNNNQPSKAEIAVNFLQDKAKNALKVIDTVFIDSDQILNNAISKGDKVILLVDIELIGKAGETITVDDNNISKLRLSFNSYTRENTKFKKTILTISTVLKEINSLASSPDLIFLVPKLRSSNGFLGDYIAKIDSTYSLESIPNEDIRLLLDKLKQVRSILSLIVGINTAGDALRAIQSTTGLKIDQQVQKIQKFLNVSNLIPLIKGLLQLVKNITNGCKEILKGIKLITTITNIAAAIMRVLKIVVKLFDTLFLPLIFGTYGVISTLDNVKSKVQVQIERIIKVIEEIQKLIQIVGGIINSILFKLQNISVQLQILQTNLESCNSTDNSPLIDEIKNARNEIISNINELDTYSSLFESAKNNNNESTYGSFILKIQEEELVDKGKTLKRRRGIALDNVGVLIEQTDLTFATDTRVIFEELKLKLQRKGVDTIYGGGTGYPEIDALLKETQGDQDPLSQEETDQLDSDQLEIKNDLDDALNSIKGMDKLRKKVRKKVQASKQALAEGLKEGKINPNNSVSTALTISPEPTPVDNTKPLVTNSADLLSNEDRTNIENKILTYRNQLSITTSRPFRILIESKIKELQTKLEKDRKARG
jgi:hypothetical protein